MKRVDTIEYQAAHGRMPRGFGRWIFRNARTQEEVEVTANYGEATKTLRGTGWIVCS